MGKICLIYNYAQHYRKNIFILLDQELPIDFVFGDKYLDVKKMDYTLLYSFKKEVRNVTFIRKPLYYQKGVLSLINENYSGYLILGETICISTWLFLFFSRFTNKKVYLWSHGWYGKESKLRKSLKKIFFNMADGVFLYGEYAKKLMISEGISENKLHVIYNSLDYESQKQIRETLLNTGIYEKTFNNQHKNIIFIGRLTKTKRLDLMISALYTLKLEAKLYNLTIIGSGESETYLKSMVNALDLTDNVCFYGASYDEKEIAQLIYEADLCVSPGNVGLTAVHSFTYGTPVITHDNFKFQMPEFEIIEDDVTGNFFLYNDINSLAYTIHFWFLKKNYNRESIRAQCYYRIDNFYNPNYQIAIFKSVLQ